MSAEITQIETEIKMKKIKLKKKEQRIVSCRTTSNDLLCLSVPQREQIENWEKYIGING